MFTQNLFSRKSRPHGRRKTTHRRSHRRPMLQQLELRQMMDASPVYVIETRTVEIDAGPEGSRVEIHSVQGEEYKTEAGEVFQDRFVRVITDSQDRAFNQKGVGTVKFKGDVGVDVVYVFGDFSSVRFDVSGDDGNDTLLVDASAKTNEGSIFDGGCDNDTITIRGVKTIAKGGSGNDTIHVFGDDNMAFGEQGDDTINVGSATRLANGNTVSGGDGVDTITIYGDNNKAYGGGGSDIYKEGKDGLVGNDFKPDENLEPPKDENRSQRKCSDPGSNSDPDDDGTPDPSEETGPSDSGEAPQDAPGEPGDSGAALNEAVRAALDSLFTEFEPMLTSRLTPVVLPHEPGETEVTLPIATRSAREGEVAEAGPAVEPTTNLATATNPTDDDSTVVASKGFDLFLRLLEALGF